MAPSRIFVFLTQALIVCCFRLEATADRVISPEDFPLGKTHQPQPAPREASAASASSALKVADHRGPQPEKLEAVSADGPTAEDTASALEESNVSASDQAGARNQVEYSLSDGSSHYDRPLHDRKSHDADADKWVGVALTLGTQLKNLNGTPDDVLTALKEINEGKMPIDFSDEDRFRNRPSSNAPLYARWKPKRRQQIESSVYAQDSSAAAYSTNTLSERPPFEAKQVLRTDFHPTSRFIGEFDDKVKYDTIVKPSLKSLKAADIDTKEALERVHKILLDEIPRVTRSVDRFETSLPRGEVGRRILRYIFNSIKREELKPMHFEEACDEFVQFAMGSYEASFGDRYWFMQLDLAPVFTAAAWELFKGLRGIKFQQVRARTRAAYAEYMDSVVLNKGMWEASRAVFEDDAVHNKVYEAVQKAYKPAYDAAMVEIETGSDLERVKHFMKLWISDSMSRAWSSVPDAEDILTVRNVSTLFQNMLAPFGPDDPFSTIPTEFTKKLGPPPLNWSFVDQEVETLIKSWRPERGTSWTVRRSLGDFLFQDEGPRRLAPREY